jgi:hypothetical protein
MAEQMTPSGEPAFVEVLVRDPLTAVTRKERLYLLAVSLIGIAMVRTGLMPAKITNLGIELDKPNRSALLLLLARLTIYFLIAFIIYAIADYLARRDAKAATEGAKEEMRFRMAAHLGNLLPRRSTWGSIWAPEGA